MKKEPPWSKEEFGRLLKYSELSDDEVAPICGHTPGAVGVVRSGIHHWHTTGHHHGILSKKVMIPYLEQHKGCVTCPVCKQTI